MGAAAEREEIEERRCSPPVADSCAGGLRVGDRVQDSKFKNKGRNLIGFGG